MVASSIYSELQTCLLSLLRLLAWPPMLHSVDTVCLSIAQLTLRLVVLQAALGNVPIADPPPHQQIEEEFIA